MPEKKAVRVSFFIEHGDGSKNKFKDYTPGNKFGAPWLVEQLFESETTKSITRVFRNGTSIKWEKIEGVYEHVTDYRPIAPDDLGEDDD